jgi:hypothetical protein
VSEGVLPKSIEMLWQELIDEPEPKHKLMRPESILRLYYGRSLRGLPQFFIRCKKRPAVPDVSSNIHASVAQRQDGDWALRFELLDQKFTHTFMSLAWNLAEASSAAAMEEEAVSLFMSELAAWKRLLTFSASDRLTLPQIRGVYAELWFALDVLANALPLGVVLDSWGGPMGAPQDYGSPLPTSFEVKSVYPETQGVRISSAEQLDCAGPLELILVRLVDVPPELAQGETLPQLISRYLSALGADVQRKVHLLELLQKHLHIDVDDDYYGQFPLTVSGFRRFEVDGEFPVIKRSLLDPLIGAVDYTLNVAGLTQFELQTSCLELDLSKERSNDY